MVNLDAFFYAENVAVIGASATPDKVGFVILSNFVRGPFEGKVYPVNPHERFILNIPCHPSVYAIKEKIDLAIIAVPASMVLSVIKDCAKKKIHDVVIVTAGFEEIGNVKLRDALFKLLIKYKMRAIGPNCLGTFDAHSGLDSLFLPQSRMRRPKAGSISFVSQSGAVGSVVLDLAAGKDYGMAKFVSYGNAINVDETDIIEYLGSDEDTKVICLYLEGVRDGKRFIDVCKKVSKKKPIIAIKGGLTEAGSKAAMSHTGSLAGTAQVYKGAFKQAGILYADNLEDMFDYAKIFALSTLPKGDRVQIITNGGGYGILSADKVAQAGLAMAQLHPSTQQKLKKIFPPLVSVHNPMDLVGDADDERYSQAIGSCLADAGVDILLVILLYQTPRLTEHVVDMVSKYQAMKKKPIVVVSTGSEYTQRLKSKLEHAGVPSFDFPVDAVRAIRALVDYARRSF